MKLKNNHVTRRFKYKDGFIGGIEYIEVRRDGTYLIVGDKAILVVNDVYSLDECLRRVKLGSWIELEVK